MHKIKLLIILSLFLTLKVSAQTTLMDPAEIYIGTSHGATASMILFQPQVKQDILLGYNGGIMFRYVNEKHKGLQIELNFSQRGWKEKNVDYARQLNYLELPFLAHFYLGNKTRFIINLGPKISYLIGEKVLMDGTENLTEQEQKNNLQHSEKVQKPFDYGITAGIGVEFKIKKQALNLEARANYSFSTIFSNTLSDYYSFSDNMNVALNLGWMIRLK